MTGTAGFIARAQLRRRVGALALLTVVGGLVAGLALSLVAGSRRSASVVDRYFGAGIDYDVQMYGPGLSAAQIRGIEGVERADLSAYIGGALLDDDGEVVDGVNLVAIEPTSYDGTIEVLEGHMPDGSDLREVAVNESFVRAFGAGAGDEVTLALYAPDQGEELDAGLYSNPRGPRLPLVIAAVYRSPLDVATDVVRAPGRTADSLANNMLAPSQFYDEYRDRFVDFGGAFDVQLAPSTSIDDFAGALEQLNPDESQPVVFGPGRFDERRDTLNTPVTVETSALLLLGLGVAIAGGVAVVLLLRAEQRGHDRDVPALRSLGCSDRQLRAVAVLRTLPAAAGATLLGVAVAVALSGRYPVGVGRQLELERGIDVNVAVLGAGAVIVFVGIVAAAFVMGRSRHAAAGAVRDSLVAGLLRRAGARTEMTMGTHFAFERGRARSLPARAAIAGGAAAIACVVALGLLVSGIERLYSVPAEHGWPWDIVIGNVNFDLTPEEVAAFTSDDRADASVTARYGLATVADEDVELLAIAPDGTAPPAVVEGRVPTSANEIALGRRMMRRAGLEIGDTVTLSVAGSEFEREDTEPVDQDLVIVGVSVTPILGESDFGEGGIVTLDSIAAAGGNADPNLVLANFAPDADDDAVAASFAEDVPVETMTDTVPARVASLYRVRVLPWLGLGFAGLLGTIVLAFVLATSVRLRTRELAVLRALGLRARRVDAILAWQGIALATATLVFGLPLGIAAGAAVWRNVTDDLGTDPTLVVTPWLFLLVPAALAVAVMASIGPARRARRLPVATLLNGE